MGKTQNVTINPMELAKVKLTIVGTTPLIVHAWSAKAKQQILDNQTGKAKAKHKIKVPRNDFMNSLYWIDGSTELFDCETDEEAEACWRDAVAGGAKFGFPVTGIKQSVITGAARGGMDVKMTELRGAFFLEGATDASTPDLAEIVGEPPVMREDMVRLSGMGNPADVRHRGEFREWSIPLVMKYSVNGKYSLEQLLNCFEAGGFVTGIGEWRPERNGQFGMYTLLKA